jgi:hypothetical protein
MILIGSSEAGHELPAEILIQILDYLKPSGDVSFYEHRLTLKNMSLASHFLRDLTFPRMCSSLRVREQFPSDSRLKQMLEDETMKRLASLVTDFHIDGLVDDVKRQWIWMKLPIKGLSVLTNLQSVGLSNIYLHTRIIDALASLPSLQSLILIRCQTERHSLPYIKRSQSPVLAPPEPSFRGLSKVKVLHSDFALIKLRISPANLREIDYQFSDEWSPNWSPNWSLLPYPALALPQLRRLTVSITSAVDLREFFRDLSSIHSLIELVIQKVWIPDAHSRKLPEARSWSLPILSELKSLACPMILLQYFVGCPLHSLDLTPTYDTYRTQSPPVTNKLDHSIPTFPSLYHLVIPYPLLIKVASPLGASCPQLHVLDLWFKHKNYFSFFSSLHHCLIHLCNASPLPHLDTLVVRHLTYRNQFNLVEQRSLLGNPVRNAFPSLMKASIFGTVDWYWSHEEKDWTPFVPVEKREYVAGRQSEWVDYKGYLGSVIRPIIVREKGQLMVRTPVSF